MELHEEQVGEVRTFAVKGRLDSTSAPALGTRLDAVAAGPGSRMVVDFARLDYISSAGFRVLLIAAKASENSGSRFVLCGLSPHMRQVFALGGFLELFTIAGSREEAVAKAQ